MTTASYSRKYNKFLYGGVSIAAIAAMAVAGSGWAQTSASAAPAASADQNAGATEVIVVGTRPALKSALNIKKNADTEVDSITATDIGSFPDASIAEALQRVSGITVTRLQSADDSSHFSGEPASVLIRGLTFVRTEFNGEDSFSADAGRGLNFNDVSPELMAGVDAYKNATADMVEGGIGGTVDLRTRVPFDSKGQVVAASIDGDYGNVSDKTTAEYSGLYSNVWNSEHGKFGLLVDLAYSHIDTETNEVDMTRIGAFCNGGDIDSNGNAIITNGNVACTSNPFGGNGWAYIPEGINYSQVLYDRTRKGTAIAAQYQSNDKSLLVTARYTDSDYHNKWTEQSVETDLYTYNPGLYGDPGFAPQSQALVGPYEGTSFSFGSNGMINGGTVTMAPETIFGAGSEQQALNNGSVVPGQPFEAYCGWSGTNCTADGGRQGVVIEDQSRIFNHTEDTKDYSLNVKWQPNQNFKSTFDVDYITAWVKNYDVTTGLDTIADVTLSTGAKGVPIASITPDPNTNYAPGFTSNPTNYYLNFVQDHFENDKAHEISAKWDGAYTFDGNGLFGWLDTLQAGVRYSDRHQNVDYSEYNWSNVVPSWASVGSAFSITNTDPATNPTAAYQTIGSGFKGYGSGITAVNTMGNFFGGKVFPNGSFAFINQATIQNYAALTAAVGGTATNDPSPNGGWNPIPETRPGCPSVAQTQAQYGCFTQNEELNVEEKTTAAYVEAKFKGTTGALLNGIGYTGNFGIRVIETDEISNGGVSYPTNDWYGQAASTPCSAPVTGDNVVNISCYLTPDLENFSNGGGSIQSYTAHYTDVLPSFNVRFELPDNQFVRFGASEGLSRPDMGSLRNYVGIAAPTINTTASSPFIIWKDPTGPKTAANVEGYNFEFQAQAGNAAVKPMTADQYDLTYENYFSSTSAFTADLFYKALHDPINLGESIRSFTNNGATEDVLVEGPANGSYKGGNLTGIEVSYVTFFDALPSPWNGLGMQANYTHTHEDGINNSNLVTDPVGNGGTGGSASPVGGGNGEALNNGVIDPHRLAGISDDSYNIVGLYEKGPWALRLAYSWRSKFLVSNVDCCIGLPVWQRASGFLDASIHYRLNDHIEFELDGKNLLNTTTIMAQQVQGDSPQTPGAVPILLNSAWVRSDQAVKFGIRLKY